MICFRGDNSQQVTFCLRPHSSQPPTLSVEGPTFVKNARMLCSLRRRTARFSKQLKICLLSKRGRTWTGQPSPSRNIRHPTGPLNNRIALSLRTWVTLTPIARHIAEGTPYKRDFTSNSSLLLGVRYRHRSSPNCSYVQPQYYTSSK